MNVILARGALLLICLGSRTVALPRLFRAPRPPVVPDLQAPIATIALEAVLATGLTEPLYVTHARDNSNRLFIVEQSGAIKLLQPGAKTPELFLDISSKVLSGGEQGLLGLAFHPQFAANRRFFVYYTRRPDGAIVVAEYRASSSDPNVAQPGETVLLSVPHPFTNHNGGMIEFGPDGYLYIGMGDGGAWSDPADHVQNTGHLLGKISRIDVDRPESPDKPYSSPPDNPYFGPAPGRDEIFASGFRNPWRFSFDPKTGELYAADVGQFDIEEIDLVSLGGNYGWDIFEGTRCNSTSCDPSGFIPPIAEYEHAGDRCSITGGYVYRGAKFSLPTGSYVFGDYCSGEIFLLDRGVQTLVLKTNRRIASFGEDEAGEIYVVGIDGTVDRIINPALVNPASIYFPRLGNALGDDGAYLGIALTNMSSTTSSLAFTIFDGAGARIRGSGIDNPSFRELPPGAQISLVDQELFGAALEDKKPPGWCRLNSAGGQLAASFLIFNRTVSILDGADASGTTMTSFVAPEIEDGGYTQLHLVNPSDRAASVELQLVRADGLPRSTAVQHINPNGALTATVTTLFPGVVTAGSDYIRATSNSGVVPFELLGKTDRYIQCLNGQDATRGSSKLYAPYVIGGSWRSAISIVNLESRAGKVTLRWAGEDGMTIATRNDLPLPARGKLWVADQNFFLNPGSSVIQGHVEITSDGLALSGSVVFSDSGRATFSSALPLVSTLHGSFMFGHIASDETYFAGIAILNPSENPAGAVMEIFDRMGVRLASTRETIPAGGRKSRLLTEYFPGIRGHSHRGGHVRVSADRGVAGFALFGTYDLASLSAVLPQTTP
jgi:glucose/arabinose dehydrogenase